MSAAIQKIFRVGFREINGLKSKRCYCDKPRKKPSLTVSLKQPLPGLPKFEYATLSKNHHSETKVTTLENGLRVASENKFGQFSTIGVLIDSGSRYEARYPSGISHFLEKLAFSSTTQFRDRDAILQELGKHGGICDCQGSRDTLIYAISAETKGLADVCNILSDVVFQPIISQQELEDARLAIGFELDSLSMKPEPDTELMELIHSAAYRDNTLGLPKLCPTENIPVVDQRTLDTYLRDYHDPTRMVLAGVGMDHQALVDAAHQHFLTKMPIWNDRLPPSAASYRDDSLSQYTGGNTLIERDLSSVSLGPNELPELAHLVIGLESCSHKDDDFVAFCVLNMLMGGGGSFSAGGPGKGMYTRLYLNVLNRHHWIHNATAYNHAYEDSGLFCVHASAHPAELKVLVEIICRELIGTAGRVKADELDRAKRQLQSMLMMNLEVRPVMFEDVGRQVLATGQRKPPRYYYDEIGKITEKDIQKAASRMLRSKLSLAALGSLAELPTYDDIQSLIASSETKKTRRFSLF